MNKQKLLAVMLMWVMIASACKSGTPNVETQVDTPEVEISLTPVQTATQIAQETQELAPARLDYEPHYQETACLFDLPPGQVEGQTVECGILEV
ncbi:MAG: hypothetical protein KAS38_05755, partial [Anaerolineales bacterium]|nr:hypothetical protein [Anaerolineales bacterium]